MGYACKITVPIFCPHTASDTPPPPIAPPAATERHRLQHRHPTSYRSPVSATRSSTPRQDSLSALPRFCLRGTFPTELPSSPFAISSARLDDLIGSHSSLHYLACHFMWNAQGSFLDQMGELRWAVTYTKHVHQKRKIYQDGILELDGPRNKVFLYDNAEKLVVDRYLKKDEAIVTGGALAFTSYIVDIGDCEEKPKLPSSLGVNDEDKKSNEKIEMKRKNAMHSSTGIKRGALHTNGSSQICQYSTKSHCKEWDVLYTTQITQKSKMYHDGILQLSDCGSHTKQVILMSEDQSVLCRKYLKSVDLLKTGMTYELPSYIVQIYKPRNLQGDDLGKNNLPTGIADSTMDVKRVPLKRKYNGNKPLHNEELKKSFLVESKGTGSTQVRRIPCTMGVSKDKSCRDVLQIISHLQKAGESHGSTMPKERLEALNALMPNVQDEVVTVDIMTPHIHSSLTFSEQGHEFRPQDSHEVANIHDCIMNDITTKAPINQHENKLNHSLNSASLSSGLVHLISKFDMKCPEVADSIKKTLMVGSRISEYYDMSKNNQDKHADQSTNAESLTCNSSFGISTAILLSNVDCGSFFSEIEKDKLCHLSREPNDKRASCGNMETVNIPKDDNSNQLAGVNTNMEGIVGMLPITNTSATVQSSSCVSASGISELFGSLSMPKMIKPLDDIPSFDLGF